MTKTTAKKGMVEFKNGHSKLDHDYGYLQEINYDDKRLMKEVIETLFSVNKSLGKDIKDIKKHFENEVLKVVEESKVKDVYELTLNNYGHIVGYKKISRDLIFVGNLPKDIDNECYTVDMKLDEKKLEALNSLD